MQSVFIFGENGRKHMPPPTTFFVNPNGTLSSVFVGEMKESQIHEHIEKIVGG